MTLAWAPPHPYIEGHFARRARGSGVAKGGLARRFRSAFAPAMTIAPAIDGLQRVFLSERAKLLRFLAVRGAGEDAEDMLQDLWQRITSARHEPIGDPLSYLFRAAENVMRDHQRSHVSRARRQRDWHDASAIDYDEQPGERALIARERLQEAEQVLAALGPRVADIFRKYRLEGMGQAAIAREFGLSLSSVEKDLHKAYRALAQLRAKFDAE